MKKLMFISVITLACLPIPVGAVTTPPYAPSWWNSEDANYWGYAYSDVVSSGDGIFYPPLSGKKSNFPEFNETRLEIENADVMDADVSVWMENASRADLATNFFSYL